MHILTSAVKVVTEPKIEIAHRISELRVPVDQLLFSENNPYYSNEKKQGIPILGEYSLNSLTEKLNSLKKELPKNKQKQILKGLFNGGSSGAYCYQSAGFLFFDIDVKVNENSHLKSAFENEQVFKRMQEIAILTFRSFSKLGIAGILYVPQLAELSQKDTKKHKFIGDNICEYIRTELGVNATFDDAQSKFRQVRNLAPQTTPRKLNTRPHVFEYDYTDVEVKTPAGTPIYQHTNFVSIQGSIFEQFNNDVSIQQALTDNGFQNVGGDRWKHPRTTSSSTGVVQGNVFFNHSSSFSQYKSFTPHWLYLTQTFNFDFRAFYNDLKAKGYKDNEPQKEAFKTAKTKLTVKADDRSKQIFDACYQLINAKYKDKVQFIEDNAKSDNEKELFLEYLKMKPLRIQYNKTLTIDSHVSEVLPEILNYVDLQKKVLVGAETGIGKTTAMVRDFLKHRPNARLLILEPLTAIADQTKAEYPDITCLTGSSDPEEHTRAEFADIVIATYEQGYKHLKAGNEFDYVVIDEAHNLIKAQSYKLQAIKDLCSTLRECKVIGLTGTPNPLFKNIGYKLMKVKKNVQPKMDIHFFVDNRPPLKIALQHIRGVKGKCILRVNSRNTARSLRLELMKLGRYKKNEILILNSDLHIKSGDDFQQLTKESRFDDNIQLIITTSIIDEGVNIKQEGFTDIVFIETEYNPMAEDIKQYFARPRNADPNRKNYFYYRQTIDQTPKPWNPIWFYENKKKELIDAADAYDVTDTKKRDIANAKNFYYSDNKVDEYYLAYVISQEFFKSMTKVEYIRFLTLNYNINMIVEADHEAQDSDVSASKEARELTKINIAHHWTNNREEVNSATFLCTDDMRVKSIIESVGIPPSDHIMKVVSENISVFEKLQSYWFKLNMLGVSDSDIILASQSWKDISRKIKLLENIETIKNPKTKTDHIHKRQLEQFIEGAGKLKEINKANLFKEWKKTRAISKNPSYFSLLDLHEYFNNI